MIIDVKLFSTDSSSSWQDFLISQNRPERRAVAFCSPKGAVAKTRVTVFKDYDACRFARGKVFGDNCLSLYRHYGFVAHPRQRVDRERLQMLVTVTLPQVHSLIVAAKPLAMPHQPSCPSRGAPLIPVAFASPAERRLPAMDSS